MSPVVLDTDVTSFLFKKDTRARKYRRYLYGQVAVLSFMTLAELDHWTLRRRWGQKRRDELARFLVPFEFHYADRDLCGLWAETTETRERQGRPIKVADAWIAATALQLGISLVTNNPEDFVGIPGLKILTESPAAGS